MNAKEEQKALQDAELHTVAQIPVESIRLRRRMDRLRTEIRAGLTLQASRIHINARDLGFSEEEAKAIIAQLMDLRERKEFMVV